MSTNTLETSYANGEIIDASHINEISLALLGSFVGRDASGVPSPSQNLGTLAIPWGNVYADGLIVDGSAIDISQLDSKPNRVVSGKSTASSTMPDFLRADGAALEFNILGGTTNLVLSINNVTATVDSDLTTTGVSAAPSTNNTAAVNDTDMSNDFYAGEEDAAIKEIAIDAVGSEISSLVGQMAAFKTPTGEIFKAFVKDATTLTDVFRGYYFNSSGNPIQRGNLSDNDTLTLMKIGWVFVEDNGSTVDVSYLTPVVSFDAPSSPATGQYWFDISNQTWKRYSGTTFEIIDRILVGEIVSDDTNTVASRSRDFSKDYQEFNNIEVEIDTVEIVKSKTYSPKISVYGNELFFIDTKINWNITTNLESGVTEGASTTYYLYIADTGERIISDIRPYLRKDLKGFYHPYESWRATGEVFNDSGSDISDIYGPANVKLRTANGYGSTNTNIRRMSVIDEDNGTSIDYIDSSSDGAEFRIRENAIYGISYSDNFNVADRLGLTVNSTELTANIWALTSQEVRIASGNTASSNVNANVGWVGELKKGDIVRMHTNGNPAGVADRSGFEITKLSKFNKYLGGENGQ